VSQSVSLSFVVPVYNVEKYLAQCLESLVSQSVSKEIIIVNDGSTDGSLAVAEEYLSRYSFITIINQHNQGLSAARNAGLRQAKGRYVYFVDSDDWLVEMQFDRMVEIADQHQADYLRGTVEQSDENSASQELTVRAFESPRIKPNQYEIMSGYQHLNDLLKDWFPACWLGFFRVEFLRNHHLMFNENIKFAEDTPFMTYVLSCPNMVVIEVGRVFYHYRLRPNSLTTRKPELSKLMNLLKVDKWLIALYQQRLNELENINDEAKMMLINLEKIRALNYAYIYRSQYLKYPEAMKAEVRHYFTDEVLQLMKKWLLFEVKL
ncbi:hypothetical protein BKK49_04180, partial [Rodentibacter rarus]